MTTNTTTQTTSETVLAHNSLPALIGYVERLEAALAFYADEKNYIVHYSTPYEVEYTAVERDDGSKARAVLADSGESEG